jgi:hypothetical protein
VREARIGDVPGGERRHGEGDAAEKAEPGGAAALAAREGPKARVSQRQRRRNPRSHVLPRHLSAGLVRIRQFAAETIEGKVKGALTIAFAAARV